jgi:curved DNA-binding protein CbpA
MGAYLILHPNAKILTLIPIIFIPWFIEIPAFFFLGFWFVLQFINAAGSHGSIGGIAWWAHIGGFIFGIIFLKIFLLLPATGVSDQMRRITAKRKTHRLQVIRPVGPGNDPHLYGTITITSFEAIAGTHKLVNIPWGFQKRLIRVTVPAGMKAGSKLRLNGLGKITADGQRGDLYLKVAIAS